MNITLTFDLSKSIDSAATDVQSAIQRATGEEGGRRAA